MTVVFVGAAVAAIGIVAQSTSARMLIVMSFYFMFHLVCLTAAERKALLLQEGEEPPAVLEGVDIVDAQKACSSCSFDGTGPERAIEAGVSELEKCGYLEERGRRLYLKTRAEHMRAFEKAVESSAYVVRR